MSVPFTQDDPRQRIGAANQKRDAKPSKLSVALDIQDVLVNRIRDVETEAKDLAALARAWDVLEDRIRILRGKIKAGSRNVAVREEPIAKKLSNFVKSKDYLAYAAATLQSAATLESVSALQSVIRMPDAPPVSVDPAPVSSSQP